MKKSVLFVLLLLSQFIFSEPANPNDLVMDFYSKIISLHLSGLPDENNLSQILPYFSPEYKSLFTEAKQIQQEFIKSHPEEKPPWIEGDLFSSLFEGPDHFIIGTSKINQEEAQISVELENRQSGKTVKWTDIVILKKIDSHWMISDILYKGKFEFKNGESLSTLLKTRD